MACAQYVQLVAYRGALTYCRGEEEVELRAQYACALHRAGDPDAAEEFRTAASKARSLTDREQRTFALGAVAFAQARVGATEAARECYDAALAVRASDALLAHNPELHEALAQVAATLCDVPAVHSLAAQIPRVDLRARTLAQCGRELAEQARHGAATDILAAAEVLAETDSNSETQWYTRGIIARGYLAAGAPVAAVRVATLLRAGQEREHLLTQAVAQLVAAGQTEHAFTVVAQLQTTTNDRVERAAVLRCGDTFCHGSGAPVQSRVACGNVANRIAATWGARRGWRTGYRTTGWCCLGATAGT